jgi:hypothetical protein
MPDSQNPHPLQKRLDLVIQLLLEMTPDAGKSMAAKMNRLLEMGCSQSETAHILGKDLKDVTSHVSKLKKKRAGKEKVSQDAGAAS